MFIDIHAHCYRHPVPFGCRFCNPEELIKLYDEQEIERGFLLPVVSPEIYLPQSNEDILEICEAYPKRFMPFCNIDPRALTNAVDAPLYKVMEYYKERGCKGIGEIMPNMPMRHPMVQNLFKHAQDTEMPVTFDGSDQPDGDFGLYDEPGLPQLEHSLQRFPKLKFIAHGPIFWMELERLKTPAQRKPAFFPNGGQTPRWPRTSYLKGPITEPGVVPLFFRTYENLYGELSDAAFTLGRDPDYACAFLTEFQDRLFFGTDCCGPKHYSSLRPMLIEWKEKGKLSQEVFDKITRQNAIKFFELED